MIPTPWTDQVQISRRATSCDYDDVPPGNGMEEIVQTKAMDTTSAAPIVPRPMKIPVKKKAKKNDK